MACEHEHSNCVLLAHQKVRRMGVGGEEERWREEGREVRGWEWETGTERWRNEGREVGGWEWVAWRRDGGRKGERWGDGSGRLEWRERKWKMEGEM